MRLLSTFLLLATFAAGCVAPTEAPSSPDLTEPGPPSLGKADGATDPSIVVGPLLATSWGQDGRYQTATPFKDGAATYPGCTTIATAQLLYFYRFQDHVQADVCYGLEHAPLSGDDVVDGDTLCADLAAERYDWDAMAADLTSASTAERASTAEFIYHVGITLNAQFGGGEGSSATGRQIENAFRYQWGYNSISRRRMSIIGKDAFGYDDAEWAQLMYDELDGGRPVMYMALQADADAGHAFVIDGYAADGRVHVNWGWAGRGNGWYDPNTLEDPSGRRWNRSAMLFRGLEPEEGYASGMATRPTVPRANGWGGNGSVIAMASDTAEGYGLTIDEAHVAAEGASAPVVFFQWEIDGRDGRRLALSAEGVATATISYGVWSSRDADRVHRDVTLPFVLDPSRDGLSVNDGEYYVVAVAIARPSEAVSVVAQPTAEAASLSASEAASPIIVDGYTWNGNGSIISLASGTREGYGLTTDEVRVHPGSERPAVFFQWEIDGRDGKKLELSAEAGLQTARVRYGVWNDRSRDVEREVSLPFVLDPAADGLSAADGEYYVIRVAFDDAPSEIATVFATAVP